MVLEDRGLGARDSLCCLWVSNFLIPAHTSKQGEAASSQWHLFHRSRLAPSTRGGSGRQQCVLHAGRCSKDQITKQETGRACFRQRPQTDGPDKSGFVSHKFKRKWAAHASDDSRIGRHPNQTQQANEVSQPLQINRVFLSECCEEDKKGLKPRVDSEETL